MKKITAELMPINGMSQDDIKQFIDWVWKLRSINLFDMDVIGYPRTVMCKAKNEEEDLIYIPLQSVLMYDSIAAKPGLSARAEALSLWKIGEMVDQVAREGNYSEIYFVCSDPRMEIVAKHGFEEIKGVRVFKRKVGPKREEPQLSDALVEAEK